MDVSTRFMCATTSAHRIGFFAEVCREKQAMKCCSVYTIRHADLSDVTAFGSEKKL